MCGGGGTETTQDGCRIVYTEEQPSPPRENANVAARPKVIECECFYVETPVFQDNRKINITPKEPNFVNEVSEQCYGRRVEGGPMVMNLGNLAPPYSPALEGFDLQRDICDLPRHENPTIPYPRPASSVELRGGQLYSGCQCVKRDGLQHDCPRTGCQGRAPCMAYPAPVCVPSGNSPSPPPSDDGRRERRRAPRGCPEERPQDSFQQKGARGHYSPDGQNYVSMGRRGYRENPPVKQRPRVPCEEHRKTRC